MRSDNELLKAASQCSAWLIDTGSALQLIAALLVLAMFGIGCILTLGLS